jgi:hypothetical protein
VPPFAAVARVVQGGTSPDFYAREEEENKGLVLTSFVLWACLNGVVVLFRPIFEVEGEQFMAPVPEEM